MLNCRNKRKTGCYLSIGKGITKTKKSQVMKHIYLTLLLFVTAVAGAQIINFADSNLKSRILLSTPANGIAKDIAGNGIDVDVNSDNEIEASEALLVYSLDISYSSIMQYGGLEYFTNLRTLKSGLNNATSIDLSTLVNLEDLDLTPSNLLSIDVTMLPNLKKLAVYGLGIGSIDLSNNPLLTHVNVGGCGLSTLDLSNLPLLEELSCMTNNLSALDVSNNTALRLLRCTANNLTALDVTMLSGLEELYVGANNLTSLNVTPLTGLTVLEINQNPLGSIDLSTLANLRTLAAEECGFTAIDLSSNPVLWHAYLDNNALTSLDVSNNPELISCTFANNQVIPTVNFSNNPDLGWIDCSYNQFVTIDVSMLPALQTFNCSGNSLSTLDVSNNPNLCLFTASENPNLQTIFMKNGDLGCPLEFILGENPALEYVCTDENEVAHFTQYFGDGVVVNSYCNFTPGGDYNTITGIIRFDGDNNGCDVSDIVQPLVKVTIDDTTGQGAAFTTASGNYTFYTGAGNFTVVPDLENPSFFNLFMPVGVDFADTNNNVHTQDFCIVPNGEHYDAEVVIAPVTPARPGFDAVYKIVYRNTGNQLQNGTVTFNFEGDVMQLVNAAPVQDGQTLNALTFSFSNLLPFENREILVTMHINSPVDTPAVINGDILNLSVAIAANGTDENPADNQMDFDQAVVGSFDPNNLICVEGDIQPTDQIGDYLHYIANFENTGTFAAENIVVKTVFNDTEFDVNSLRILNSSDPVMVHVQGNTAEYVFNGINLAIGGHGNILLKIKTNNGLQNGDTVVNRADIFFDYNLPITTNDAETTFQMLSVGGHEDQSIAIYPNPTNGQINVTASTNITSLQLYDIQGRLLQTALRNEPAVSIDISGKQNGVYFLKVISDKGTNIEKIVKK